MKKSLLLEHEGETPIRFNIMNHMIRRLTTVGFIKSLAHELDKHVADLPRLDDYIDTDYFNDLLAPCGHFTRNREPFMFNYDGLSVEVTQRGAVRCLCE